MESNLDDALPGADKNLSAVASSTPIATPNGERAISDLWSGERVLTASVSSAEGKLRLAWEAATVGFSNGTSYEGIDILNISMDQSRIASMYDTCFLLANGKYIRASRLRVGMQLVDKDGIALIIRAIVKGRAPGGVHAIATDRPWNNSPDGHLLLAAGVVIGDFIMKEYFDRLPESMKESA